MKKIYIISIESVRNGETIFNVWWALSGSKGDAILDGLKATNVRFPRSGGWTTGGITAVPIEDYLIRQAYAQLEE